MDKLNLIVLILSSVFFSQSANSSLCHSVTKIERADFLQEFGASIFRVFANTTPLSNKSIGTATLIDSRGLFITAAHILEGLDGWQKDGGAWENGIQHPFPNSVRLINPITGVDVLANEVGTHRGQRYDPDISILMAVENAVKLEQEDSLRLLMGKTTDAIGEREVLLVGFSIASNNLTVKPPKNLTLFKEGTKLNHFVFIEDTDAAQGLSGSLVIDRTGIGVAVLKGGMEMWELENILENADKSLIKDRLFFSLISHKKVIDNILPIWKSEMGLNERTKTIKELIQDGRTIPRRIITDLTIKKKYYPFELYLLRDELIKFFKEENYDSLSVNITFIESLMAIMNCYGIDVTTLKPLLSCFAKIGVEGKDCNVE